MRHRQRCRAAALPTKVQLARRAHSHRASLFAAPACALQLPKMRVPLAGGGQESLLSEVGAQYLLPLFTTRDACALRLVCREFLAAVTEQPWEDRGTVIMGSIGAWRACFPRALCASVASGPSWRPKVNPRRQAPVVDADFVHLQGLLELNMSGCREVTDAAFAHLRGVRALNMNYCSHLITDAAFEHLRGSIRALSISMCRGVTGAAFAHLCGIHTLDMSSCNQISITDAAFVHLRGIHTRDMGGCSQAGITDAALVHLRGVHNLNLGGCTQFITEASFAPLRGVHALMMGGCSPGAVAAARAQGLRVTLPEL